jgi:gliding motility-associated lipoprotein GldD
VNFVANLLQKFETMKYILLLFVIFLISCGRTYTPKPSGYFRIAFPEKKYVQSTENLPYSFEYPVYGVIKPDTDKDAEPYWINIEFPQFKGEIHISYKPLGNLASFIEDARTLAYKHTIKADAINEIPVVIDSNKVYGMIYDIKGNAASSIQFYLTDSSKNFLRGALYFKTQPNKDSIAPVVDFFSDDINHFIYSVKWKNKK